MGIKDLLKKALPYFVRSKTTVQYITSLGKTRAVVDCSGWIHDAAPSISVAVVEDRKQDAILGCNVIFKNKLDLLGHNGVLHVHFVFDGNDLPAKAETKAARQAVREEARTKATQFKALMDMGGGRPTKTAINKYQQLCTTAFQREPWLENGLCTFLNAYVGKATVSWKYALYEADAQIAHLLRIGCFDFGIAQDQDFAMYGANCMVFKLGYKKWKYDRDECDWMDLSAWDGPIPPCQKDV